MKNSQRDEQGNVIIEVMLVTLLLVAIMAKIYSMNFLTNDLRQLSAAKNLAVKEVQWTGGLTPSIIQDAKNILVNTDYNSATINIWSPQGLDPKVPLGGKIEVYITATTKSQGGMDNNLKPTTENHTSTAYGVIVSQYVP